MDAVASVQRLSLYSRFVKLEHTVFSLPLIYAGALLARRGGLTRGLALLILLAAVGGRVAAMGLNRIIDAEIDRRNPRTQIRELPQGLLELWEGWVIVTVGTIVYIFSATHIAPVCLMLAPIPLILFAIYPYLKRVTTWTHVGLGIAWSVGPLAGWLAVSKSVASIGEIGWLWLFSILWVAGFDIIYATMDIDFDQQEGLFSIPARWGYDPARHVAAFLHVGALLCLAMLWWTRAMSLGSLAWLAAIAGVLILEYRIAERNPHAAFFQCNAIIGFLVLAFVWTGT